MKQLACAAWGFCEATLFFLVPDVLLTRLALDPPHSVLRPLTAALAGALVGGTLMYGLGMAAASWVAAVPAISEEMIRTVGEDLVDTGITAMILGPLTGTPYKVYAIQASAAGIGLPLFLAASIAARVPRFLVLAGIAHWAGRVLGPRIGRRALWWIWAAAWTINYAIYWTLMPW